MNFPPLLLIFCMMLVTYIPRAVPALFVGKIKLPKSVEKFLKLIPYTAMSALIFPGVFTVDEANLWIGMIGAVVAGILAWKKCPVMVCVISAIAADFILYLFF